MFTYSDVFEIVQIIIGLAELYIAYKNSRRKR